MGDKVLPSSRIPTAFDTVPRYLNRVCPHRCPGDMHPFCCLGLFGPLVLSKFRAMLQALHFNRYTVLSVGSSHRPFSTVLSGTPSFLSEHLFLQFYHYLLEDVLIQCSGEVEFAPLPTHLGIAWRDPSLSVRYRRLMLSSWASRATSSGRLELSPSDSLLHRLTVAHVVPRGGQGLSWLLKVSA